MAAYRTDSACEMIRIVSHIPGIDAMHETQGLAKESYTSGYLAKIAFLCSLRTAGKLKFGRMISRLQVTLQEIQKDNSQCLFYFAYINVCQPQALSFETHQLSLEY